MKHIADPMEHPFCGVYCYFLTLLVSFYSYAKFMDMAAKGEILPENLPPTERVQHSLRVHLQAVAWQTLDKTSLGPLEWGWKEEIPLTIQSWQITRLRLPSYSTSSDANASHWITCARQCCARVEDMVWDAFQRVATAEGKFVKILRWVENFHETIMGRAGYLIQF